MSRVFLAEEARLGRQVVIKVLPPEMGAGVNVERFEREIQLAARLQHPHIVPLLTAGADGDLLYYVMPFIAGESLRVKLAREGELPVTEAVRILSDVVDALAYAHRNGVVHRDIKPDNVLLSEGHAVVTDFGVAKAVSASSGSGSLTSLGVALGTPAYMAPEQAAADPHVDHRADIYAVGALAYEMLCGRPPFVASSAQAMLAAQITQAPEPVTRFRPAVSGALNALVLRCLEKRAADRWQSAAELVPQLQSLATPSGGLVPATAQTAISSGTESAIRRAHPARVAGWFVLAAAVVLGIVWLLVLQLGLPYWVLYGAGALLAIGLPIMLATGHHERRRAVARTLAAGTPVREGRLAPWFTWKKALLGGGVAFAGLAVVAATYTAMRVLGIGPVGTLVASGVLKERESLLLADFENHTPDSTLGPSLTEAFRVDLSQSPTVRLADAQTVRDALQRMERPAGVPLDPPVAREVAERLGLKAIVSGQIDPVGRGYVLSAGIRAAADGRVLVAVRETAADQGALLGAIDRLSSKLRERIGESLVTIRANPPLEQVSTSSLAALRKYSEAVRLADNDRPDESIPLLEEAVALDTGFAMAYRKLAALLGNLGESNVRIVDAASRAFAHRDRLPELERDLAVAYYHSVVDFDPGKAIAAYRSALAIDPDNTIALNNLALMLNAVRRWAEAETLASRATRIGYSGSYYDNLLESQLGLGRLADARVTVDREGKAAPTASIVHLHRAAIAANEGDYPAADRELRELQRQSAGRPAFQALATELVARASERSGKLAEATRYFRDLMALQETRGLPQAYVVAATQLAEIELRYRNRPGEALAIVTAAQAKHPLDSISKLDRPLVNLAAVYARAGKLDLAKRLMRQFETEVPEGIRRGMWWRRWTEGHIALAEGRKAEALTAFRALYEDANPCNICGLYEIATVHDAMGQADSAIAFYQRAVTVPAFGRLFNDSETLAPALRRLGELYEAKGDQARAREYYGRFVDLWKEADPELQPGVKEVRDRLVRLAREPGT
jgi:tetratricopeptide (TPR) repeat protein